jgi:exodeoxyribonuclease X
MSRDTFLKSVTVIDTETTHLKAELAEIVEVAGARYDGQNWQVQSRLLGAKNGIPPEASAKNNISSRMIAGLPTWNDAIPEVCEILNWPNSRFWVAHNCPYDQGVLATAWDNSGADHQHNAILAMDRAVWICTHRLAKKLLNVDFPSMEYNLSYLRYRLDLPVSDDLPAHRANADTLVCAVLFEFLVDYALATDRITDGPDIAEQMHALCWNPIMLNTWPFGKHKGQALSEIPNDYYIWAMDNLDSLKEGSPSYDADLAASVAAELEKRIA